MALFSKVRPGAIGSASSGGVARSAAQLLACRLDVRSTSAHVGDASCVAAQIVVHFSLPRLASRSFSQRPVRIDRAEALLADERHGSGPNRRELLVGVGSLCGLAAALPALHAEEPVKAPAPRHDIKLIVFDTFGTVVDWRGTIIAEGRELSRAKNRDVDWAAFADAWRAQYRPSMDRVRRGELPWTNLDRLHRMSLDQLLPTFNLPLNEAETERLNRVWHRCRPWPDSVPGLTRLRTAYTIAPLSNGNISLITNMAKLGGLPWDCVLGAEIVQRYKPDPEVYSSPATLFALERSEVMMVAAHQTDLRVPKELGLRTAYVHRPYEGGTSDAGPKPSSGAYDYIVDDLLELASALGS
jgi:2-haloacid dehalogenase